MIIVLWIVLFGVSLCDPNNYPVVFNFSDVVYDDGLGGFSKEMVQLIVTDKLQLDKDEGFLKTNIDYRVRFNGQIEQKTPASYEYSINAYVYSYTRHFDYALFCLPIEGEWNIGGTVGIHNASCCLRAKATASTKTYTFGCSLDSDTSQKWTMKLVKTHNLFAWQFYSLQYKAQSGSSFSPAAGELNLTFWDQDGSVTTEAMTTSETSYFIPDYHSIGHMSEGGTVDYQLNGQIPIFSIYNELNDGGVQHRNVTKSQYEDNYIIKFDFQKGSQYLYQDNLMKVIGQKSSSDSTTYTISEKFENPNKIIPTSLGWVFGPSTTLETSLIPYLKSFQFMVEVEAFCLEAGCQFGFEFQDEAGNLASNTYQLTDSGSTISPSFSNSSPHLVLQNFSLSYLGAFAWNNTRMENAIKTKYLRTSDDDADKTASATFHNGDPTLPTIDEVKLVMNFEKIMISTVKFYRHLKSTPDVRDEFDSYKEADDVKFNFMQGYATYPAPITSQPDVCEQFMSPNNVCLKQDANSNSYCQQEFSQVYNFCADTCGDGIIQVPQTLECDDGNIINGDGCNSNCKIETGYVCSLDSQGKSTCIRSCGDGVKQSLEQCDDGNDQDGDGCNSRCFIENGYKCDFTDPKTYCYPSCGDQVLDTGELCDDGNLYNGDGCSKTCTPETGFNCDNTEMPSKCTPLCGNGVKDSGETCDDKNSMDFDGCDKNCQIEDSYNCEYNETLGRDLCISTYFPPIITSNQLDYLTSEIKFTFNDTMTKYNFTGSEVSLAFVGPAFSYKTSSKLSYSSNNILTLKYSVSPSIVGGSNEELLVAFSEVQAFESTSSIPISNQYEFKYKFDVLPSSETAKGASSTASITLVASFVVSVGISVFTGKSMEQMWSLANTLQIVFFLGLMSINFPPNLRAAFEFMKYSNFDNPVTSLAAEWLLTTLSFGSLAIDGNFAELGFDSSKIIFNSLDKVLMILGIVFGIVLFSILSKRAKGKSKWYWKLVVKIDNSLRYESSTRFIIEISMVLSMSIFVNLLYSEQKGAVAIASYCISIMMMMTLLCVLIYCYAFPLLNYENIKTYPDKLERHCILFLEFKRNNPKTLQFYYFFMTRRILLAAILVGMKEKVLCQLVCVLILFYWNLKYQIQQRPFASASNNFLNVYNETSLLCFVITLSLMNSCNESKIIVIGYASVGLIIIFFIVNITIILSLKISEICSFKCKKKKRDKKNPKTVVPTVRVEIGNSNISIVGRDLNNPEKELVGNMNLQTYISKFNKEVCVFKLNTARRNLDL
ncbi:unnamed protein product [Moneuplotes crassus]|uniref:Lipoprotein n=1 Tax=Euplotes crassus TaxID=5936 RepID=A0AAD1X5J3_EUPCR|nr:unnamed protein product [Moneuplotes crassus]